MVAAATTILSISLVVWIALHKSLERTDQLPHNTSDVP